MKPAALSEICEIHGGIDAPMPRDEIDALLPEASLRKRLARIECTRDCKGIKAEATIEVAGAFREGWIIKLSEQRDQFYPVRLDFETLLPK